MWPELESGWSVVGVGDFNGDGIDDLMLHNTDGRITNWLGSANGGFTDNYDNAHQSVGTRTLLRSPRCRRSA